MNEKLIQCANELTEESFKGHSKEGEISFKHSGCFIYVNGQSIDIKDLHFYNFF